MRQLVQLSLPLFGLGIAVAAQAPALAQEQENPSTPGQIPDPSTYQGSTVLQQQSDQQDQSFRQQQQEQSQGYQQQYSGNGGRSGYSGGGSGSAQTDPGVLCIMMLPRSPALASLRGLVELGLNSRDPRYFTINRRPTAGEKPALLRSAAARRQCPLVYFPTAVLTRANMALAEATNRMIIQLAKGLMTYGQFNYKRSENTDAFIRFRDGQ